MGRMADFVAVKQLLEQLDAIDERLTPVERDLVRQLTAKYEVPGAGDFDDKLCLEVILRNVEIRAHHGLDPAGAAARRIDLGHKSPGAKSSGPKSSGRS